MELGETAFEILHQEIAPLAERLAASAKKEIDQQPDSGREEENEHPCQRRLRPSVFHQQEYAGY
jgi:hypothetical protein